MKSLLLIGLLGLALAAWCLMPTAELAPQSEPAAETSQAEHPAPATSGDWQRETATLPSAPTTTTADAAHSPAGMPTQPAAALNHTLAVVDAVTQQPLPQFSVTAHLAEGRELWRGTQGQLTFAAPLGDLHLRIEAIGYQPAELHHVVTGPSTWRVPLVSASMPEGIELHATFTDGPPVRHALVQAFAIVENSNPWRIATPLWSRRAQRDTGAYRLPTLAHGKYGIRLLATDADGAVLPFLPFESEYELNGGGFLDHAVLAPGCIPVFTVVDRLGAPLPEPIAISLHWPGGAQVPRSFLARDGAQWLRATNQLPDCGSSWPEVPVEPGTWEVELTRSGYAAHRERIALRSSERQAITLRTAW